MLLLDSISLSVAMLSFPAFLLPLVVCIYLVVSIFFFYLLLQEEEVLEKSDFEFSLVMSVFLGSVSPTKWSLQFVLHFFCLSVWLTKKKKSFFLVTDWQNGTAVFHTNWFVKKLLFRVPMGVQNPTNSTLASFSLTGSDRK